MVDYTPKEVMALMNLVDTYKRWSNFKTQGDRSYEYYHPSELGKCLRSQQYKHFVYKGYIKVAHKEFESQTLRLFDKGHSMHNRWSNYFADMGVLRGQWFCKNKACYMFDDMGQLKNMSPDEMQIIIAANKTRLYGTDNKMGIFCPEKCKCGCNDFDYKENPVFDPEIGIKGSCDLLLDCSRLTEKSFEGVRKTFDLRLLPVGGKVAVGDMKTIGQSAWDFQLGRKGPHKEYLIQLTIYAHILDCDYGVLMYENKNNSEMKWYKVDRNDEWWEIIKWQVKMMRDMASKKQLPPPRPAERDDYACKGCEFMKLCHSSAEWDSKDLNAKRKWFYKCLL
jgi:CRISPR/Cas system-associated exonuclease Cas4 (RecB family)